MNTSFMNIIHRIHKYLQNRIMVKFILSYLIILLIPLLGVFILNNEYFISSYKKEVINRNHESIQRLKMDFDSKINLFSAISGQLSTLKVVNNQEIYRNVSASEEIIKSLQGFVATHEFFDNIAFYSTASPNTVYTSAGTFNTDYYLHYRAEKGDCTVNEKLLSVNKGIWTLPKSIYWPKDDLKRELEYAIPSPCSSKAFVMFYIPESSISSIVFLKDVETVIFDKDYQQLYPFEKIDNSKLEEIRNNEELSLDHPLDISGGRYLLCSRSENSGLLYTRIIPKDVMMADVTRVQRVFTVALIFLVILGGILVYLMAFLNYRPINKISKLAADKVKDIPTNIYGMDRAFFAIENLDKQLKDRTLNNQREKLLYRIIHGKRLEKDTFDMECMNVGLCFSSCFMRVLLIFFEAENNSKDSLDVLKNIDQILSGQYELNGMEYLENNCYMVIIGYDTERSEMLKNQLKAVALNFSQYIDGSVKIAVGGRCTGPFELSQSYFQAVLVSKLSSFSGEILFYDDTQISDVRFVYPKIELDTLFSAIINANTGKIKLITDILVDMIHANSYNKFISVSLCYDIINTYIRAMDELNAPRIKNNYTYSQYENLCRLTEIKSFIDIIYELRNSTIELINTNTIAVQPDDTIVKIMSYIDSNYKDIELCVSNVAEHFNMSISNISHQFKSQIGVNISDYISGKKLVFAKELLRDTEISISDVAIRLGYNQTSSFIRKFKSCENMTPNEYRLTFGTGEQNSKPEIG